MLPSLVVSSDVAGARQAGSGSPNSYTRPSAVRRTPIALSGNSSNRKASKWSSTSNAEMEGDNKCQRRSKTDPLRPTEN
jgi:hypothetical protein